MRRRHSAVLYEIVLRYPDRERVVVSETPLERGMTVELAGRTWVVLERIRATGGRRVRFICGIREEDEGELG
jgi:hypothetical protein